ncbi:MAG: hypothetical protein GY861_25870 [bacterium]|nr:hypothetical protein [bacterium]
MKSYLALISSFLIPSLLVGCSRYAQEGDEVFNTQKQAAVAFYKRNVKVIDSLSSEQEMLGWVLKCKEGYRYTNYVIGGVSNPIRVGEVNRGVGCKISAHLHTHPKMGYGKHGATVDFFSEGDVRSAQQFEMYLMSAENCNIRYIHKTKYRYGNLLGKINCKNFK